MADYKNLEFVMKEMKELKKGYEEAFDSYKLSDDMVERIIRYKDNAVKECRNAVQKLLEVDAPSDLIEAFRSDSNMHIKAVNKLIEPLKNDLMPNVIEFKEKYAEQLKEIANHLSHANKNVDIVVHGRNQIKLGVEKNMDPCVEVFRGKLEKFQSPAKDLLNQKSDFMKLLDNAKDRARAKAALAKTESEKAVRTAAPTERLK